DARVRVVLRDPAARGLRALGRGRRGVLVARVVVPAAGGDEERSCREQRGGYEMETSHGAVWILLLVRPKRARARPSAPRSSLMPAGVTARWTADRPTSAAIASTATMIEAPIWPS